MRRIIVVALSTMLFVSTALAQQTPIGNRTKTTKSGIGIDTVVNCTTAANNYIPVFTAVMPPNITICNSAIYQNSSGDVGIGTKSPAATLDVNGGINTATTYQIGGNSVLSIGSAADNNLFLGMGAGANNVAVFGNANTFAGFQAGTSNTYGGGNTFFGAHSGSMNTTGIQNTFVGMAAGASNTTGGGN